MKTVENEKQRPLDAAPFLDPLVQLSFTRRSNEAEMAPVVVVVAVAVAVVVVAGACALVARPAAGNSAPSRQSTRCRRCRRRTSPFRTNPPRRRPVSAIPLINIIFQSTLLPLQT